MALYRRGKTYWVAFTDPRGKRIRQSTGTTELKAAQEYHDTLKAELWRVSHLGEKPRRSWQEAVVKWLEETSHKATHERDKQHLRRLDPYLGRLYLDEVNRAVLDQFVAGRRADGVSNATINRHLAVARSILRKARDEWDWVDKVPKVKLLPEPKRRVRWLTREQVAELLSHLPAHLEVMVRFSLATGLRQGNVIGLEWSQVDLERRLAWIHPDQAKARRAIGVPLNAEALAVLKGEEGKHSRWVFTYRGKQIKTSPNNSAWQKALRKAGLQDFRWHDLRHTWASWHVQSGTPLQALQELGAWESTEMVRRYAHLGAQHLEAYADGLCHVLDTPPGTSSRDSTLSH